jgi:hypothetical protein
MTISFDERIDDCDGVDDQGGISNIKGALSRPFYFLYQTFIVICAICGSNMMNS